MTNNSGIISFVIPTLNFAEFLPETLDSILAEGYLKTEIIVFDGGSCDNTLEVLESYKDICPELIVIVAKERGNIDVDLNKAVASATGEYIWTLSADDVLVQGWSQVIVPRLKREKPDLLLVPAIHCDIQMRPRRNYPILKETKNGTLTSVIEDDADLFKYLDSVRTSEGLFSFCSACIVRRDHLLQTPVLEQANGTCWRYAARLISVLTSYPSMITVLNFPLIQKRGDNDSFASSGMINRLRIATLNWDKAIGSLGLNEPVTQAMLKVVKADIRPFTLLYLSQYVRDGDEQIIYRACVDTRIGRSGAGSTFSAGVLKRMPRFAVLRKALEIAKDVVRIFQQRLWATRIPVDASAPYRP